MNLSFEMLVAAAVVLAGIMLVLGLATKKTPRKLNTVYFQNQWQDLQKFCANKDTWPLAIMNADKLLDEALVKRKFTGKTMGERMVSAQRVLTENDSAWRAHKLRNRLAHENNVKLKQHDVRQALMGFRQALKDLGAL